ncbi:MAG: 1,2-phenylacetyl-CoA epoxidase subunit PaaD [Pseudomonadota bacterium]
MPVGDTLDMAAIEAVLHGVEDPEIPVISVMDLGIVRAISAEEVAITPTYKGCPATAVIETSIRAALDAAGFERTQVKTVLSPPWSTDFITDEGRAKLKAYGIAPPPKGADAASLKNAGPAECPNCGSHDTREISRFGSTPCKALWQCSSCLEPFDRFKCH